MAKSVPQRKTADSAESAVVQQAARNGRTNGLPALNGSALRELYTTMASRHLQVFPELLEFPMQLGKDTLLTASLRNSSPSYIAFKVKTTATERYRVRPNLGVVAPGETAHVKLVLVAQTDYGADLQNCRDRFLVQSLPVLPGQHPDTNAFKAQKFKVQDHKLRVSVVQVHNAPDLGGGGGTQRLQPVASPLEKEIRESLLRIAEEQGADGHRSCLTKFSELLLLNGVISTQQMGVALDLVEALFDPDLPEEGMEELNRSVHTWLEESEHSGAHSDDGMSSPSHAGMSAASSNHLGPDKTPPPVMTRGQLATIISGVPSANELFPTPKATAEKGSSLLSSLTEEPNSAATARSTSRSADIQPLAPTPDINTAKPQDLFPSPPETPTFGAAANGRSHTPLTANSDYKPPPLRRVEDSYQAAPDSFVSNMSTDDHMGDSAAAERDTAGAAAAEGPAAGSFNQPAAGTLRPSTSQDDANGATTRPDLLSQLLSPKGANSGSPFSADSSNESPARNLAAMLRSTLRSSSGGGGGGLREAFSNGNSPLQGSAAFGSSGESWQQDGSFAAQKRQSVEGVAEA